MAVAATATRTQIRKSFNERALTWLAIGMFLFLYLPIIILIIYSFNENRFVSVWTGFSTHWYGEVFRDPAVRSAMGVSLWLAGWSTVVSTILGTLTAIVMERFKFWGKRTYDAILYLPIIIPDIVMALSTLLFFVILGVSLSRYTVLIAHIAFNIAFVAIVVRARLADMDAVLEEAASDFMVMSCFRIQQSVRVQNEIPRSGIVDSSREPIIVSVAGVSGTLSTMTSERSNIASMSNPSS